MSGRLSINGNDLLTTFDVEIGAVTPYSATGNPEDAALVPGRVGALVRQQTISIGGFEWPVWPDGLPNEIREYTSALYTHKGNKRSNNAALEAKMAALRRMLLLPSNGRLLKLEDSYEPGTYRLGYFSGDFSPIRKGGGNNFEIPLRFSVDPRRFVAGDFDVELQSLAHFFSAQDVGAPLAGQIGALARPVIQIEGSGDALSLYFKDVTGEIYGQIDFNAFAGLIEIDTNDMTVVSQGGATLGGGPFINDTEGECVLLPTGCTVERSEGSAAYILISPRWWVR